MPYVTALTNHVSSVEYFPVAYRRSGHSKRRPRTLSTAVQKHVCRLDESDFHWHGVFFAMTCYNDSSNAFWSKIYL